MNELITLAHMAAHNDPELADIALEEARSLLPGIQPLERRSSELQNLIRARRAVDGEVGSDLLLEGFILADQMRREQAEKESGSAPAAAGSAAVFLRQRTLGPPSGKIWLFSTSRSAMAAAMAVLNRMLLQPEKGLLVVITVLRRSMERCCHIRTAARRN